MKLKVTKVGNWYNVYACDVYAIVETPHSGDAFMVVTRHSRGARRSPRRIGWLVVESLGSC